MCTTDILFTETSNLTTSASDSTKLHTRSSSSTLDSLSATSRETENTSPTERARTSPELHVTHPLTPTWESNKVSLLLYSLQRRHGEYRLCRDVLPERCSSLARTEGKQQARQIRENQREETHHLHRSTLQRIPC